MIEHNVGVSEVESYVVKRLDEDYFTNTSAVPTRSPRRSLLANDARRLPQAKGRG